LLKKQPLGIDEHASPGGPLGKALQCNAISDVQVYTS
jgi:hypothetical protein